MVLLLILGIITVAAVIFVVIAAVSFYRPASVTSSTEQARSDRIAKLDLNNTRAQQAYLQAINEGNITRKIELMKEANMYQNGTWAETCRLYPELKC